MTGVHVDRSCDGQYLTHMVFWKEATSLEAFTQQLNVRTTWDRLPLPLQEVAVLQQVAEDMKARQANGSPGSSRSAGGQSGVVALLVGSSGTVKTMAAEVLATELGRPLYRIDLAAVRSQYIGETEKNLSRVFDEAERVQAILFFDEADALFGGRTDAKDPQDRYANLDVAYLVQRLESFGGLAILATNSKTHLDKAFLRRIRYIINTP
ncbi:MAG: ATP-binding protein [Nitrospira sp.]|nr:ATP-binding protein [Nitrospira sp.]